MNKYFSLVREYLTQLNYPVVKEIEEEGIFIIDKEEEGIKNMIIAVADPILIIEQYMFEIKKDDINMYKSLLQKNQDIIHGAFAIDESGKLVIFRDTLQVENLDLNELEGTLNSFTLLIGEYAGEILKFSS